VTRVLFAGGGTGGHLYPALALADAMRAESPGLSAHFVGARRGVEAHVLPRRGEPHTLLPIEPVYRSQVLRNWRLLPSLARSLRGIARLFRQWNPQLVVGTGGYASAPACLWAVARRVPMAVQEQNAHPGATTRMLARWARQVHLGFPEAAGALRPGRRTLVLALGNPIQPPDARLERGACRAQFGLARDAIVVLVVGGSQGSRALNEALLATLAVHGGARPRDLEILWATGPSHIEGVTARLAQLGSPSWVRALGYIDAMPGALAAADIALSRAGAMMTAELLAWGIPAVLVPLPTAAAGHQAVNARALAAAGAAIHVEERELTPAALWHALSELVTDGAKRQRMSEAARARARPHAARDIARELLGLVSA